MNFYVFKTWLQARLGTDERGATMVEYALVVALIAVVLMVVFGQLGTESKTKLTDAKDCVANPANC